jgi:hypothetical protein
MDPRLRALLSGINCCVGITLELAPTPALPRAKTRKGGGQKHGGFFLTPSLARLRAGEGWGGGNVKSGFCSRAAILYEKALDNVFKELSRTAVRLRGDDGRSAP